MNNNNRRKQKYLWLGVIVALSLILTSQCSFSQKLRIMTVETDPDSQAWLKGAVETFEKRFPDAKVSIQYTPYNMITEELMAGVAAGAAPDVATLHPEFNLLFTGKGVLLPLEDVIDELGRDRFAPGTLTYVTGHNYYVPYEMNYDGLNFLRVDLFKEKGIDFPQTWSELLECAKTLTEDVDGDGSIDRFGMCTPAGRSMMTTIRFLEFLWPTGGRFTNLEGDVAFDSPATIKAAKFYKELLNYAPPEASEYGFGEMLSTYYAETVAMTDYCGRIIINIKRYSPQLLDPSKTKIIYTPTPDGTNPVGVPNMVGSWVVMAQTKHPDFAKEFIYHVMTGEEYLKWTHSVPLHVVPIFEDVRKSEAFLNHPLIKEVDWLAKPALEAADHCVYWPVYAEDGVPNPNDARIYHSMIVPDMVQSMFIKNVPVEEAVAKAAEEMEELIRSKR